MSRLGFAAAGLSGMVANASALRQISAGQVVRNGCDTTDPLDKGTFFLKKNSGDSWVPYDPVSNVAGGHGPFSDGFTADQIFLPVEHVSQKRLMEFRADLKLYNDTVKPARALFERALGGGTLGYCYFSEVDDEYDGDDERDEWLRHNDVQVKKAWQSVVKFIKSQNATL